MLQTRNFIAITAGAAASAFLALLASSPTAAADPTEPPGQGKPNTERRAEQANPAPAAMAAEQPKSAHAASVPESLKTTAMYMKAIPATPALVLQSTSAFVTGTMATPAEILVASAQALGAFGIK